MDERTKRFLDAALERGFVEKEQAEECLRLQETVREVGVEQGIDEILVKKGYLTPEQAGEISRSLVARRIGKYQILEKLGEGGAGIVYRARQEPLDRVVAIKVLSKSRVELKEYLDRFRREARTAVTLNHENIVRGLDYGEADGYHYFAMEFVNGESLAQVLEREGSLDEKRALEIVLQTVQALIHASEYHLVHRDIKPENILLTPEGVAKLCDLGLAKPTLAESAAGGRSAGTIGTPLYMSPEQIRGKDETDFRADIYSLGVTLYHLVAGRPPFRAKTVDDLVRMHLREVPTDPREFNLELSQSATSVILKMMAKDPDDRYPSLESLSEDLQAVLGGRPPRLALKVGAARPSGKVHIDLEDAAPRRARRERTKRSPALLVVLALAVAGIGAGVFFATRSGKGSAGKKPRDTDLAADPEPDRPAQPDAGEQAYRDAMSWLNEHADASFERKRNRFDLIAKDYPGTPWERSARDRIREFEEERDRAARERLEQARSAYEDVVAAAEERRKELRYGDAISALGGYPGEFADTPYPEKLAELDGELRAEARSKTEEALAEADKQIAAGYYEPAAQALGALDSVGIPELEEMLEAKRESIRAALQSAELERERGFEHFRSVVGTAYARAAGGEFREAEDDLVLAGDEEKLSLFRRDLDSAWRHLREARRFHSALVKGAHSLVGRTVDFEVRDRSSPELAGKVTEVADDEIRVEEGAASLRDLVPLEQSRIAFTVLDEENGEDRAAAALYFVVVGSMQAADEEIEAAGMRGVDTAPLTARRELLTDYDRELAEAELTRSEKFTERGLRQEAMEALEKAAASAPFLPRAHELLGVRLVVEEKREEGLWELDRALALGSKWPDVWFYRGVALQGLRRRDDSIAAFRKFLETAGPDHPKLEDARRKLENIEGNVAEARLRQLEGEARDAFRRRNWDDAITKYRLLLELSPEDKEAIYYIAKAELEKGSVFEGYTALRRYVAEVPRGGRTGAARRELKALEKKWGGNDVSQKAFETGLAEFVTENYVAAIAHLDEAVAVAPLDARAYYQRGMCRLRTGDMSGDTGEYQKALSDFERATLLDPADALSLEGLCLCQYYLTDYERALVNARAVMNARPTGWVAYYVAGMVHLVRRQYLDAQEQLSSAIKRAPGEAKLFIRRAEAFEGLERYSEAVTDLETAKRKSPTRNEMREIELIEERIAEKR